MQIFVKKPCKAQILLTSHTKALKARRCYEILLLLYCARLVDGQNHNSPSTVAQVQRHQLTTVTSHQKPYV